MSDGSPPGSGAADEAQAFGWKYFLMLSPSVLNSTRVPRSCLICFLVRLIMPWRLPRWACSTLPPAVTLKRFLAPDLVFSLGIWLSCCRRKIHRQNGVSRPKCSLERWKCYGFRQGENPHGHRHGSPFVSRAMKAGLMAEQGAFGNDEP